MSESINKTCWDRGKTGTDGREKQEERWMKPNWDRLNYEFPPQLNIKLLVSMVMMWRYLRFTSRGQNTWYQQMYRHGCWLTSGEVSCRYVADQTQSNQVLMASLESRIPLKLIHQMSSPHLIAPMIVFPPQPSLFLFASPPLILYSSPQRAAKSLIQEVFLLCSCIKKVTVVEFYYRSLHRIQHLMILHGLWSKCQSRCFSHIIMIDVINPQVF